MPRIHRTEMLGYSPKIMFDLVQDIQAYPQFLPWCTKATVVHLDAHTLNAALEIKAFGMTHTFSTKNVLRPYNQITLALLEGPLTYLTGQWLFVPKALGCQVVLELDYEFASSIKGYLAAPLIHYMTNIFVKSFSKRAEALYGR